MNIRLMLARLQEALNQPDLTEKILLLPGKAATASKPAQSQQPLNLVVGYNGSVHSQAALDLTLWIAYQTRLATRKPVTVQVVYVATPQPASLPSRRSASKWQDRVQVPAKKAATAVHSGSSAVATPAKATVTTREWLSSMESDSASSSAYFVEQFEEADRILWQARCLGEEWRGSLKTHLRFGSLDSELRNVVEAESASLLILGCQSAHHPMVQALGTDFPCAVLGIPTPASLEADSES